MNTRQPRTPRKRVPVLGTIATLSLGWLTLFITPPAHAADTVCARVKIEIQQELTLERQAFDAMMRITNGLGTTSLDNVAISVNFKDELGLAVRATSDTTDTTASFFIKVDSMDGINDVSGNGTVAPGSIAEIHWLIIPAPGAGGTAPAGKLYFIGAHLSYLIGGKAESVDVIPDFVYVKPLPLLNLDYFLTKDVFGDDPLTPTIEPIVPYTLGVRVKNVGAATARNLKIESAQPKIVENNQGLAINFQIIGSSLNDLAASPSLLIPFGDIPAAGATSGRWLMTSSLAGTFVDFTATFTHADELGGALTSLIPADGIKTHFLVRDVKVDLPGRDNVRDFLAWDGNVLRVYESSSVDTLVTDQSGNSVLTANGTSGSDALYALNTPATAGVMYVKRPDPFNGTKALGRVTRTDGKIISSENVWLSKERNPDKSLSYYFNLFDANTPGLYNVTLTNPANTPQAPVLQFIPDHTVTEGQQVSFVVEASDADGTAPTITTSLLPAAATFTTQAGSVANLTVGIFNWTPPVGASGRYPITYTASDGTLTATATSVIIVNPQRMPGGPDVPQISAPQVGTEVRLLQPTLVVSSTNGLDSATHYQYEVYADVAMTTLVAQIPALPKTAGDTSWKVPTPLADNTPYYWRARGYDGSTYSAWATARFTVNTANDAPGQFNLASPANGSTVDSLTPTLSVSNSTDADGDVVTYAFEVYADSGLTQHIATVNNMAAGANGITTWTVSPALSDTTLYYWRALATDSHGAETASPVGNFLADSTHPAPGAPGIAAPAVDGVVTSSATTLSVTNSLKPQGMVVTYTFELDRASTFNSPDKIVAAARTEGVAGTTSFDVTGLMENAHYTWRVKASDGLTDSPWTYGRFLVDARNDPPSVPTLKNPGNDAWLSTRTPLLEVNPSVDPEGDTIAYHVEIYSDSALTQRVADHLTNSTTWRVDPALTDDTRYTWRVRAEDLRGGASAWSAPATFLVKTVTVNKPVITVTAPATHVAVTGTTATIAWDVQDPEHNSTIALYYDNDNTGADGTLIVNSLPQDPATTTGSYTWDVSAMTAGTYYIYAIATNSSGTATRYAPGAFTIPVPSPRGGITVTPVSLLETTEAAGSATFTVVLTNSPKADVTVGLSVTHPVEARVTPVSLTFTQANWNVAQTVTVVGLADCLPDGDVTYKVITAKAESLDPDYLGVKGADLTLINRNSQAGCPSNLPPQAFAGPDQIAEANASVILTGSGTDADGAIAAYAWSQTAGPTVTLTHANTASATFTAPALSADTTLTFTLTVTDNQGATATDSLNVLVHTQPNVAPTASAGLDQTVVSGTPVTLTGSGTDSDGTIASYAWTQIGGAPTVTLTSANSATAGFTAPTVTTTTVFGFQLTVTDNQGATGSAAVSITVKPVPANVPPVANAGLAQSVNEGAVVTLAGSGTDSDGTIASYAWTQTAGPTVTLINANTATATFTAPQVTADSVLTFQLKVTDNLGATGSATVNVTVKNVNLPPTANAGAPYTGQAGQGVTFSGSASSDPEGSALTYLWAFGDGATATGVSPTHAYAAAGTFTITLTVNDGVQDSAPATTTAQIIPALTGTVLVGMAPSSASVSTGSLQPMAIAATNQTGQTLSKVIVEYSYSAGLTAANLVALPSASVAQIDTANRLIKLTWTNVANGGVLGAAFTVSSATVGTYTLSPSKVQMVLSNGATQNLSANTATVTVVAGNQPPVVSAGADQTVNEGAQATLSGSATDPDGSVVGTLWTQTAGPSVTLSNPLSLTTTFIAPQVTADTVLTFKLTAVDNQAGVGSATVNVTVHNLPVTNLPPTANAGPDQTKKQKTVVTLNGSASTDSDGTIVSYRWRQLLGPTVTLANANAAVTTFTAPSTTLVTAVVFELTVTDNSGAAATDTVTIAVTRY